MQIKCSWFQLLKVWFYSLHVGGSIISVCFTYWHWKSQAAHCISNNMNNGSSSYIINTMKATKVFICFKLVINPPNIYSHCGNSEGDGGSRQEVLPVQRCNRINCLITPLHSPGSIVVNEIVWLPAVILKMLHVITVGRKDTFQKYAVQQAPSVRYRHPRLNQLNG